MKRIFSVVSFLALALGCATSQKNEPVRVRLTPEVLAGQPPDTAYVIDLTRDGTVYEVPADIDYARARVRTSKSEMPLSDAVKRLQLEGSAFLVGSADDLGRLNFGFPPGDTPPPPSDGVSEAQCNGIICGCSGKKDCGDLGKATGGNLFCGKMPANDTSNTPGRTPGTWGCVTEDPKHT
jgi:hypothetical protein